MSERHYDYEKQCWVVDGVVQACYHPEDMDCGCYGREHVGELIGGPDQASRIAELEAEVKDTRDHLRTVQTSRSMHLASAREARRERNIYRKQRDQLLEALRLAQGIAEQGFVAKEWLERGDCSYYNKTIQQIRAAIESCGNNQ